jgi:hypothetical protein
MGQGAKALEQDRFGFCLDRNVAAAQRGERRCPAVLLMHGQVNDDEGEESSVNGVATARAGGRRRRHAPGPPLAAALGVVLALVLAATHPSQVLAQSSAQPAITVSPAITAEPASQAAFPIRVGPADAVPRNSFVRLRGLPPMAALSEGHSIAPGAWAVPLGALPDLKIMLPAGSTGRSEIVVTLVAIDGKVLAETKSTLAVSGGPKAEKGQAQRDAAPPVAASILRAGIPEGVERNAQPSQPVTQPSTPQDRERALRLVKKGDEQLTEGNVSAARLFYERAADAGLAQGAMALAATFDGAELARLGARGIQPDTKQARRWYERARQLGASDAEDRLRRIGTN